MSDQFPGLVQAPAPGTHMLRFCGDVQVFTLTLSSAVAGEAKLRTNLGRADTLRREIIQEIDANRAPLANAWFDYAMPQIAERTYQLTLPLCDVGHFEAKCWFYKLGDDNVLWPDGANVVINVEPADTCAANSLYNVFVRQFGPNKKVILDDGAQELIRKLDDNGYIVIPPSGTFRDVIHQLDFIIGTLGCRIVQLLPIHPTPTAYGRLGRYGSPYAALNFTSVDPALAEFDSKATPLEQFYELVDAIHQRQAKLFLDIAINHTGWAASLHETHPKWLKREADGNIEMPGAWGIVWEDLTALDYTHKELWQYMAAIFLTWCRRGVDGFRCDAGYMVPVKVWKYIVAVVREQYPDTVFFLEGLGGSVDTTREILNSCNFNWAYSELFQNYDRQQIESYLASAADIALGDGVLVHFAETHDNLRLAARSPRFATMRVSLCALFTHHGGFAFANGVEWFATEKINVHGASSLNWGAADNQVTHIQRLNALLKTHPTFYNQTMLNMIQQQEGNFLVLLRHHLPSDKRVLVLVNLDETTPVCACWPSTIKGIDATIWVDLLTGLDISVTRSGDLATLELGPGQVLCLSTDKDDWNKVMQAVTTPFSMPTGVAKQRLQAKVLAVLHNIVGYQDLGDFRLDQAITQLHRNPLEFCRDLNPNSAESRVTTWRWPQDKHREVMILPGYLLLVQVDAPFRAQLLEDGRCLYLEVSMIAQDGTCFALFLPAPTPDQMQAMCLRLAIYTEVTQHIDAPLLLLPRADKPVIPSMITLPKLKTDQFAFLGTNGRGGMLRVQADWLALAGRYDALLAANLHDEFPIDRWISLVRLRAWVVYQDYAQALNLDCLKSFSVDFGCHCGWQYQVPVGQGKHIDVRVCAEIIGGENAIRIVFYRLPGLDHDTSLPDSVPVKLIVRPDLEDRSFHDTTKAYLGAEQHFPASVSATDNGFVFAPDPNRQLHVRMMNGEFVAEPEWLYEIHWPLEAERGLEPKTDVFSPGYLFSCMKGGETKVLSAAVATSTTPPALVLSAPLADIHAALFTAQHALPLEDALMQAMSHYLVKRENLSTVIAGYPWFLDWGRDTLIFVRGLIAIGETVVVREILQQFGQFEENGTIPNTIRGADAQNRDTSDAPLWFFVVCKELVAAEGGAEVLEVWCGQRRLRDILVAIGHSLIAGTANGIHMDPESGLLFSPSHFTWMDTNYPAGTPRQGYPIEIQALWHVALSFLRCIDPAPDANKWTTLAEQVAASINAYFWLDRDGYLADCLHANPGESAKLAVADDALRPNQLFAITLGAFADTERCRQLLANCETLLIPGAIRSLADKTLKVPLEIIHKGNKLCDPHRPYQGRYIGDEDTCRKPAYHNGTAWTWVFPSFCEAWVMCYGSAGKASATAWLASSVRLLTKECLGHIPEILDGDYPHRSRGCDAQAWGVSELLRVWRLLYTAYGSQRSGR